MSLIELEADGLLDLLDSGSNKLDPMADFLGFPPLTNSSQAGGTGAVDGLASTSTAADPAEVNGDGSNLEEATVPGDFSSYVQRFKETFIKSRSLEEIRIYAQGMTFKDYLDYVVKLLPKDVKIQGEFNFVHQLEQLGPIDRSAYLLPEPEVVDCEVSCVNE